MSSCGVFTGILFSRKPCGQPAAIHCGRCNMLLCKVHLRPQASGPFLCPSCDAYEHDDGWNYSSRDNRWRHDSGSSSRDERVPAAAGGAVAGAATGVAAGDLTDADKEGFATGGTATTWHSSEADADTGDDSGGFQESDFDAS